MNWLKVVAVVIGGLIAFLIVGSLVHLITMILGWVLVLALVAGGGYLAYRVVGGSRREIGSGRRRRRDGYGDREVGGGYSRSGTRREAPRSGSRRADDFGGGSYSAGPPPRDKVEDELSRLKREMGDY